MSSNCTNYLAYYLGHHPYERVLYFLGNSKTVDVLEETMDVSSFKHFVVVSDFKGKIPYGIETIHFKDIESYKGYVCVFDNCLDTALIQKAVEICRPKCVIGFFQYGFDLVDIWRKIRGLVEEMHLARMVNQVRNEVLEWTKQKDDIELSVILPTYNVSKYLDKCLETLTEWDVPYVEFLFVNDGSKDDSRDVVLKWAKKDARIKLLDKENGGCASAREYGLEHAKGRYVGFIDPDDFIDPEMYRIILFRALMGTYDIAYSGYNEYYEETGEFAPVEDVTGFPYTLGTSNTNEIDALIAIRRVAIWRGIYRRQFLIDNDIHFHTELRRFDDLPFKVETLARAKSVVSVDECLYYYRMGRPGQDVSATDQRLYVHFDIFKLLDNFFKKYRSSKQLDYYYQVKVQTHYWALTLLDNQFIDEYLQKASLDLDIDNKPTIWKKLFGKYYRKKDVDLIMKRIERK